MASIDSILAFGGRLKSLTLLDALMGDPCNETDEHRAVLRRTLPKRHVRQRRRHFTILAMK
jgi:hypothetical protein